VLPLEYIHGVQFAESQGPKLITSGIMSEEFQRVSSQSTNVTYKRTDRQTDNLVFTMTILHYATFRAVTIHDDGLADLRFVP